MISPITYDVFYCPCQGFDERPILLKAIGKVFIINTDVTNRYSVCQ